jgi:hypothetical protein
MYLHYGPAMQSKDANQLMEDAKAWIDSALKDLSK